VKGLPARHRAECAGLGGGDAGKGSKSDEEGEYDGVAIQICAVDAVRSKVQH